MGIRNAQEKAPLEVGSGMAVSEERAPMEIESDQAVAKGKGPVGDDGGTATRVVMEASGPAPEVSRPSFRDILKEGGGGSTGMVCEEPVVDEVSCNEGDISFVAGKYGPGVRLSEAFKERLERRWDYAVVVKLLGRTPLWQPTRSMKVVDLDNDFFLVRLDCEEDYFKALAGGPWVIMGHALSVQPWDSSFRAAEGQISQDVIWARFAISHRRGITLKCCMLWVGDNTKAALRGKFARVVVEARSRADRSRRLDERSTAGSSSPEAGGSFSIQSSTSFRFAEEGEQANPTSDTIPSSGPAAQPRTRTDGAESPCRAVLQGRAAPEGEPKNSGEGQEETTGDVAFEKANVEGFSFEETGFAIGGGAGCLTEVEGSPFHRGVLWNGVSVVLLFEPRISGAFASRGPRFTWQRGLVWERLDRALANQAWVQAFPSSQDLSEKNEMI
ncbi:hypothetical protein Tsubulata_042994 [Turnera subulata]|uniref:DUF4283 domain-containing protein n=1 Tax=Turnera subulata TaxID=218843 RepID=A0A9Q0GJ12_9ROSI|nr:hypothetical protein Tsubulata_042994 [Turnera subulata]